MATRGIAMTISFVAWDTSGNSGKSGDDAQFTMRWVKDGTSSAPDGTVAEVDATNCPGLYKLALTATETDANIGTLAGVSSTADVSIIPATIQFERLPNAAPGASTGLALTSSVDDVETKIDTVDTVADGIATTLGTAGAGLTDLGAMSTGMKAEVNAEADTALSDYDGPTKAEMDSKFSTTDGLISTVDSVADGLATTLGTAGAGLTDLGAMSTAMKAEVNTEVDTALSDYDAPTTAELDAAFTEIKGATWASGTDTLEGIRDRGDAAWITATSVTVSGTVSADVVSVSGDSTAAANLESDYDGTGYAKTNSTIGTTTTNSDMRGTDSALLAASAPSNFADLAITASTGRVTIGTNSDKTGYSISGTLQTLDALNDFDPAADTVATVTTTGTVTNGVTVSTVSDGAIGADAVADIWSTTALAESYASDGSTGTGSQLLYQIQQALTEFAISSTTVTVKKLDGSTTASTYTLDDASAPTSRTRAS